MPNWMGSIRFRLTVIYSGVLFGLAAVLVGAIYLGAARTLDQQQIYQTYEVAVPTPQGLVTIDRLYFRDIEQLANERALETLRRYTFAGLSLLFLTSLGVGWIVAGRVLRPIEQITDVAADISANDLSRRIDLGGPPDELRHLADTFDDMLDRIDDAFEEQRRFVHEASHELRNPLAVIRTNLEVTLSDPAADTDELRHTLEVVDRSTERMSRLVDDLLVYARKGTTSREMAPVDVSTLVVEAVDEFTAPASARRLHVRGAAAAGLWVMADRHALKQALANLLANAVRLAPEGTTVQVTAGSQPPWVWLAVQDEGPGIAPEDQDRVFQRFYRGDGRAGREEGRSGLGLTIVRQIAQAHGGAVKLVSEPGVGSAFAIWLPQVTGGPAPTPPPGPRDEVAAPTGVYGR
jgi:signal transduction histidine kinase